MLTDSFPARAFRAALVAMMMMALAEALLGLFELLVPGYGRWWLLPAVGVVTVEAIASLYLAEGLRLRGRDSLTFRLVEFGLLLVVLRLLTLPARSLIELGDVLAGWAWEPLSVFDAEYVVLAFVLAAVWLGASGIAEDLLLLEFRAGDFDGQGRPLRGEESRGDRTHARDRLTRRFFWGGALLLFFIGLPRLVAQQLERGDAPTTPWSAVVYFVAGITLLSQAHLVLMQLEWFSAKLQVDRGLERRWRRLSLGFIALVAVAAALLPTGYAGGLLASIQYAIAVLGIAASFVTSLIVTIVTLPWLILLSLLSGDAPPDATVPPPEFPAFPPAAPAESSGLEIFGLILFWVILFAVMGYILSEYFRTRGGWIGGAWLPSAVRSLLEAVARLWEWARGRQRALARGIGAAARSIASRRLSSDDRVRWPRLRLSRLTPQERVRYFYLSLVRRAAEAGYPRPPAQTPSEYASDMAPRLGERALDWETLTGAFLRARYAPEEIDAEEVTLARVAWRRLRRFLQRVQNPTGGAGVAATAKTSLREPPLPLSPFARGGAVEDAQRSTGARRVRQEGEQKGLAVPQDQGVRGRTGAPGVRVTPASALRGPSKILSLFERFAQRTARKERLGEGLSAPEPEDQGGGVKEE